MLTPAIRAIAQQMWDVPYRGALKRLYLQAKVMELLVIYLDWIAENPAQSQQPTLKPDTINRLYHAKYILNARLEHPPSLLELAQQVGVSDRTLQRGFRAVFQTTVMGYLKQQRLKQAERLLRQGNYTVAEVTESGLQVILETEEGSLVVPETRAIGNALIADIPNAAIAEEFSQANPIEGIALVSVTSLPGDRVRVAITGTDAPPVAEVRSEAQGLVLAVTVGEAGTAADEDAIQVVVTGEQDEGYNPSSASTATRTDTPLRDIPQSITVVPREVLDDRNVQNLTQAIETVAGAIDNGLLYDAPAGARIIRGFEGFDQAGNFRNGLRDVDYFGLTSIEAIERVEVLRGPASVLFGALEPGGVINV